MDSSSQYYYNGNITASYYSTKRLGWETLQLNDELLLLHYGMHEK